MSIPQLESPGHAESEGASAEQSDLSRHIRHAEQEEPLLRRLLAYLAEAPATPTTLAQQLQARKETISRLLKDLRESGVVEARRVPGDRRRRRYSLTATGEVELRRHYSYGDPGPAPVEPSHEETIRFLYSGLRRSVELRRQDNQLLAAADRQRKILKQAQRLNDGELILDTTHELATTLRQVGQVDEVDELLNDLNEVALGRASYEGSGLSLQASAHRSYALGRKEESVAARQGERMSLLITATTNYCELARGSSAGSPSRWRERQAWSAYSLAANMRAASRLDDALRIATSSLELFEKIDDLYGRAHCHFLIGFCMRLMGDFHDAGNWLDQAHRLAGEGSYERLRIDSLMQIGEVHRCRGELAQARAALERSRNQAEAMNLSVTQAFAQSALGSVAFGQGRWLEAQRELGKAEEKFVSAPHWEGQALNARRLAIAARFVFKKTQSGDLQLARRFNDEAQGLYRDPNRPAGVVACSIEHDRLRMCEGLPPNTIDNLLDLIENRSSERECLELDPWVPPILVAFADETQNGRLISRAREVFDAAREKRVESLERAVAIVGGNAKAAIDEQSHQSEIDEMGGETRLEGSLMAAPVAVPA